MLQLICEGACNPMLPAVDRAVQHETRLDGHVLLSHDTVSLLRRLTYTAHEMVGATVARCGDCGHVRQYGSL
jgi:hypothetical protein